MAKQNEHGISWTDRTWNFIRGCSRISRGCGDSTGGGCYAEAMARRFSGPGMPYEGTISDRGKWNGNITFHEDKLLEALKWKKPQRVFVNSMSDLFHENVQDEWIDKAFAVMALTPHIQYQILTKRPDRMLEYFKTPDRKKIIAAHTMRISNLLAMMHQSHEGRIKRDHFTECFAGSGPFKNIWLGVSAEDQKTADERIPHLLNTPAAVRFLSLEPLLGPVDIRKWLPSYKGSAFIDDFIRGERVRKWEGGCEIASFIPVDWVIVGGESGPNARPMHPDWVRSIRDQCVEAGIPFHFKQWGEWKRRTAACVLTDDSVSEQADEWEISGRLAHYRGDPDTEWLYKIGKKKAGRLLDGREWNEFPEANK